jgi:rubrerythrin
MFAGRDDIAGMFDKLARDERTHESQFQKLLDRNPRPEGEENPYGHAEYLRATAISRFFSKSAIGDLEEIRTPRDALAHAYELERATLLFYYALRDAIGEDTDLDEIIAAEKDHLTTLMKVVLSDAEFRGLADRW